MIHYRYDFTNKYYTTFDDVTGAYFRSNVMAPDGSMTEEEPFMGDFPHLIDVGIMGKCDHGLSGECAARGVFCYQEGDAVNHKNMALEDYIKILEACEGKVQQLALGGRGDADCHEDFEGLLKASRDYGIVPNITTSGFKFDQSKAEITKAYCGAAAVSWYDASYTYEAIKLLVDHGVTTNIHYILSEDSIVEACRRLETKDYPQGISAVIFLLYKPIGRVNMDYVLKPLNPYLERFFSLIDDHEGSFGIGFDSCSTTGIVAHCHKVEEVCIEPCEAGRFSAYIDADMVMYPCSFVQDPAYAVDLRNSTIEEAWKGQAFNDFRQLFERKCPQCSKRQLCLGGCPSISSINLCSDVKEVQVL